MIKISFQFFGGRGSSGNGKSSGGGAGGAKATSQTVPSTVAAVKSEITQKFEQTEYANATTYEKAVTAEYQKYNDLWKAEYFNKSKAEQKVIKKTEKYKAINEAQNQTSQLKSTISAFNTSPDKNLFKSAISLVHPQSLKQFGLDMNNTSKWIVDYYKDTKTWQIWSPKKNLQPGDTKTLLFDKDLNFIGTQIY